MTGQCAEPEEVQRQKCSDYSNCISNVQQSEKPEFILKMNYVMLGPLPAEFLYTKVHTLMHEYTLVHMLCKLVLSTEAVLKFLEKPLGQAGIHLGSRTQGRFEPGRAEKFTQLQEKVKETHQQSY